MEINKFSIKNRSLKNVPNILYMATMGLNILYIKEKEICPTYISKINSNYEKEIILLMVSSEEKEG